MEVGLLLLMILFGVLSGTILKRIVGKHKLFVTAGIGIAFSLGMIVSSSSPMQYEYQSESLISVSPNASLDIEGWALEVSKNELKVELKINEIQEKELRRELEKLLGEKEKERLVDSIVKCLEYIAGYILGLFSPYLSEIISTEMKKKFEDRRKSKK